VTAADLLDALRAHGVRLALDGDRVRLVAPRPPPAELVEAARVAKADLVDLLRVEAECDRVRLFEARGRLLGRIHEIEALGHHEGRWVRGSRVPPETAQRLEAAARGALAALREDLARVEAALDVRGEGLVMPRARELKAQA